MSTKYTQNFAGSNIPKTVQQAQIKPQQHNIDYSIPATDKTPYIPLRQTVDLNYPNQVKAPQQLQPTLIESSNTIITQLSIVTAPNMQKIKIQTNQILYLISQRKINGVDTPPKAAKDFGPTVTPNLQGGATWKEPLTQVILTICTVGKDGVSMSTSSYSLYGTYIAPTIPTQSTSSETITNTVVETVRLKINKASNSINLIVGFTFVLLLNILY
ncbi:hypothetical protein IMG5_120860 [Ichthyophthirius multifiliis]|uniref:Uncharacterized protein n=1 Tax=Ichthyophthirius multifiliis TaxID=5932 RepID=G0QV29_ICHMU|nr:hypothetical protein IMG5_120860 [Ichthyophthirius multifiliis]EGR30922.1 hypothetical protein IMG5_120860 [Ichthyophthirius multifiliis]|eukprot:XP_004032509.1 hypothetical protein IMG5_120860 [Ichthyophthirius multifiliis]